MSRLFVLKTLNVSSVSICLQESAVTTCSQLLDQLHPNVTLTGLKTLTKSTLGFVDSVMSAATAKPTKSSAPISQVCRMGYLVCLFAPQYHEDRCQKKHL